MLNNLGGKQREIADIRPDIEEDAPRDQMVRYPSARPWDRSTGNSKSPGTRARADLPASVPPKKRRHVL